MGEVIGKVVKQHVTKPAADDHGQDQDHVEVLEMVVQPVIGEFTDLAANKVVTGQKAEDIHQAVPAHRQRADLEDHRVNFRKDESSHSV